MQDIESNYAGPAPSLESSMSVELNVGVSTHTALVFHTIYRRWWPTNYGILASYLGAHEAICHDACIVPTHSLKSFHT